jgi:hypothetical protein
MAGPAEKDPLIFRTELCIRLPSQVIEDRGDRAYKTTRISSLPAASSSLKVVEAIAVLNPK